ncbi:MAG: histidine phosphatase family protein [Flavobacteriaceae bacterium]|nr:histidine phosphatase family protein [Flavobacteriaceae bacterium]
MKTLYLIRHAKSAWDLPVADQDRPLAHKGVTDAYLMGAFLKEKQLKPDLLLSSPANRALHTAIIISKAIGYSHEKLQIKSELYDFYGDKLLQIIRQTPDTVNELMVFAHNNAVTNTVNILGNKEIENVSTCGFVHLSFDVAHWSAIQKGITQAFVKPKQLKS